MLQVQITPNGVQMTKPLPIDVLLEMLIDKKRDEQGNRYSFVAIADGAGLSQPSISNYANGVRTNPGYKEIAKLARFFDISPAFFFCKTKREAQAILAKGYETDRAVAEFLSSITRDRLDLPDTDETAAFLEAIKRWPETKRSQVLAALAAHLDTLRGVLGDEG